jgi:hypothetical protein
MQQGSSSTAGASGAATAILTDEQILGLEPMPAARANGAAPGQPSVILSGGSGLRLEPGDKAKNLSADSEADGEILRRPQERTPQNDTETQADQASRLSSAESRRQVELSAQRDDPAWLTALESRPEGGREAAAEARQWRDTARDIASLDAAYFGADPAARGDLAARLYTNDPAAFRAMLAEGARMLSERDPQALADLARQLGAPAPASAAAPVAQGAPNTQSVLGGPGAFSSDTAQIPGARRESSVGTPGYRNPDATAAAPTFPADAYRSFEAATNDEVSRRMRDSIDRTLASTLPQGIAEGARRRISEDIFDEMHATLAADRDLTRQVSELLRGWRFDSGTRQQVAGLVAGRARAVLPEVARRVVGEWTSSVLASDRARTARMDAAASRRDITGGRLPEPVPVGALRPRDLDYARLSDEQILGL